MQIQKLRPYLMHTHSTINWYLTGGHVHGEAALVVEELRKNGIAVTSAERLDLKEDRIQDLYQKAQALVESPEALERKASIRNSTTYKDFFFELLGNNIIVDKADIFTTIALDPVLLSIANTYLKCYSELSYHNVWLNVPVGGEPKASQLWHRDSGDSMMLKMFFMISEMTLENGAFSYIPGTQWSGRRATLAPPAIYDGTERTLDAQMRQVVPESDWVTVVGGPGTIIFADTRGFHKGGFVHRGRRLLFIANYNRWLFTYRHSRVNDLGVHADSRAARYATRWR